MDMVNLNVVFIYFISFLFYLSGKFSNIIINFRILVFSPLFFLAVTCYLIRLSGH